MNKGYKLFEIDTNILMYSSCMSHQQELTKTYCHLDIENAKISLSKNPLQEQTYTKGCQVRAEARTKIYTKGCQTYREVNIIDNYSIFINVPINTTRQKIKTPNETLVSLHKSNLQKAIRLGNKTAAITSLEWLYRSDPIQLFRRLLIILLEDSSIHPYFSLLLLYSIVYNQIDLICLRERNQSEKNQVLRVFYNLT